MLISSAAMTAWLYQMMPQFIGHNRRSYIWWSVGAVIWLGVFMLVTVGLSRSWTSDVAFGIAASSLGALGAIDLAVHRLPLIVSYTTLVLVTFFFAVGSVSDMIRTRNMLIGAGFMIFVVGSLRVISRGSLGQGDVHLAPLLGALIGWFDPFRILVACSVMAVSAGVVASGLLLARRRERSDVIAYGPFMLFGAAVAIVGTRGG